MELTKMDTLITLLLLLVSMLELCRGTANFGFDSANSCSPNGKMSRRGRAQMLAAIPCDLGKQPFCHLPGSIYPWHAVRRFVHENQGLMKRMYGDVRHISILRDEIQNNEVLDVDDIEDAADRYSKTPRGAKFMLHGRESERDEFGGYKGNDVLMEPHFRPVSTMSPTTTTTTTTTTSTPPTTTTSAAAATPTPTTAATPTPSSGASTTSITPPAAELELEVERERPSLESNSVYELPTTTTTTTTTATSAATTSNSSNFSTTARPGSGDNIQVVDSPQLGELSLRNLSSSAAPATPTTLVKTHVAGNKRTTTLPHRKQKPGDSNMPATGVKPSTKTSSSATTTTTTTTTATVAAGALSSSITSFSSTSSSVGMLPRRNVTRPALGSTTPISFASLFSSTYTAISADKQRRPLISSSSSTTTTTTPAPVNKAGLLREGGQLFQDAMKQEPMTVTSNMRGVNACPVKDEVVAPFWANNTRGEVLALLNLYPFEQYVHWEKCTHEFKQMFCRDGCRCEQQYRLHRLLAYDPHNECRGIFSDWFRFPSSCICKCYNIPMDFRATSRSPRSDSSFDAPQSRADPVDTAEAEVQRAIYEHATDQWYRPRDEYDFYEG